jgi:hypothetical protein
MVDAGLVVGWDRPVPGKERAALELFGTFTGYLSRLQKDGTIDSYEPVLLQPHGGGFNGFILIRGQWDRLSALTATDDFRTQVVRGEVALERFGVVPADVGGGVARQMSIYGKNL